MIKNKKYKSIAKYLMSIAAVCFYLIVIYSSGDAKTQNNVQEGDRSQQPQQAPVNVSLVELEKAYSDNPAALEQKYKNIYVVFDCTVSYIESVQFTINCSDDCMFGHTCYMANRSDLTKLSKNQHIRMKCQIDCNLALSFNRCEML